MGGPGPAAFRPQVPGPAFLLCCSFREAGDGELKVFWIVAATALCLGACTLPTNVKLKKIDELRAEQTACLSGNVPQFDDNVSDPAKIGRYVAMSCNVQTEKLVYYAVPHPTEQERRAFDEDAMKRATGFVIRARSGTSG